MYDAGHIFPDREMWQRSFGETVAPRLNNTCSGIRAGMWRNRLYRPAQQFESQNYVFGTCARNCDEVAAMGLKHVRASLGEPWHPALLKAHKEKTGKTSQGSITAAVSSVRDAVAPKQKAAAATAAPAQTSAAQKQTAAAQTQTAAVPSRMDDDYYQRHKVEYPGLGAAATAAKTEEGGAAGTAEAAGITFTEPPTPGALGVAAMALAAAATVSAGVVLYWRKMATSGASASKAERISLLATTA